MNPVLAEVECELSVIMPCLNEAETVGICVAKAKKFIEDHHIAGEIVIADNGSVDGSQKIAAAAGARVVQVTAKGYGHALRGAIKASRGKFIIMGDSDDSYDFYALRLFVEKLRQGYDLVMGNRFLGGIDKGAMPWLHKYLGNPVLSFLGNLFFKVGIGDFHCGLRGFKREAIEKLELKTGGMEFASEMVVKAKLAGLKITEVPTTLFRDGRSGKPHLRSWRDGWRHLRFLLIYSPKWLFAYPGLLLIFSGMICLVVLAQGQIRVGKVVLDVHTMLYASYAVIMGVQILMFYLFANVFAVNRGYLPLTRLFEQWRRYFSLERGLMFSLVLLFFGFVGAIFSVYLWYRTSFGPLSPEKVMRIVIPAATCLALGVQSLFATFFLALLQMDGS